MNTDSQTEDRGQRSEVGKECPRCPSQGRAGLHSLSDFGVCRARKDGLNLYCKVCIREKITESRIALRAYKKTVGGRKKTLAMRQSPMTRLRLRRGHPLAAEFRKRLSGVTHPERVVLSLTEFGKQSFPELRHSCRLTSDQLSDALAHVIGDKVGSRNGTGPRVYFINDGSAQPRQRFALRESQSYGVSDVYSSIYVTNEGG